MIRMEIPAKKWSRCVKHSHDSLLSRVAKFQSVLLHLKYEGKPRLGKNIAGTRENLRFLDQELAEHFTVEEKGIFPFLGTHVPRLAPAIQILELDHNDIKNQLRRLRTKLSKLVSRKNADAAAYYASLSEIQDIGSFIVHFVKSHLKAEDEIIHEAIKCELYPEEEQLLWKRVSKVIKGSSPQRRRAA